jgi:hypothetical protein
MIAGDALGMLWSVVQVWSWSACHDGIAVGAFSAVGYGQSRRLGALDVACDNVPPMRSDLTTLIERYLSLMEASRAPDRTMCHVTFYSEPCWTRDAAADKEAGLGPAALSTLAMLLLVRAWSGSPFEAADYAALVQMLLQYDARIRLHHCNTLIGLAQALVEAVNSCAYIRTCTMSPQSLHAPTRWLDWQHRSNTAVASEHFPDAVQQTGIVNRTRSCQDRAAAASAVKPLPAAQRAQQPVECLSSCVCRC